MLTLRLPSVHFIQCKYLFEEEFRQGLEAHHYAGVLNLWTDCYQICLISGLDIWSRFC
jgi:hypothetical protein